MADERLASPIRVGFDDQIFEAQSRGGISKYFVELLRRLPGHGIEPVLLAGPTRNLHLAESGLVPRRAEPGRLRARAEWASWRALGRPRGVPARLPDLDLMHHTFSHPAYLRLWRGPRVVTVYDMTPERFPRLFRMGNPHFAKRRYCEAADAIIAISESTASDIARFYGPAVGRKVTPIPLGVGSSFFAPGIPPANLPGRYLLYVGARWAYKDFPVALEAFARISPEYPDLQLLLVGGGRLSSSEEQAIRSAGLTGRVSQSSPTDAQLPEVYRRAAAFVFPSRYEGFGLPTLEALAEGTPAIIADASCGREVGGAVASYFPPGDVATLVERIRQALTPQASETARAEGPRWARRFDWDLVAARTAEVYRGVLRARVR